MGMYVVLRKARYLRIFLGLVLVVEKMSNMHPISRLHYVRGTAEEAKYTAEANHSNNRWKAGQREVVGILATYEQFRNGNYFGTL